MPGPHINDIKSEFWPLNFIMFNFLYIRHAFILWDIYPISYRYGFFPRPANRNLQCKLNLPIRLVLGHMSEITLKILMKSGTFGLCQNKIDGFFFFAIPCLFFFLVKEYCETSFCFNITCTSWPSYFKKCKEVSEIGFIFLTCHLKRKVKYCLGLKIQGVWSVPMIPSKCWFSHYCCTFRHGCY